MNIPLTTTIVSVLLLVGLVALSLRKVARLLVTTTERKKREERLFSQMLRNLRELPAVPDRGPSSGAARVRVHFPDAWRCHEEVEDLAEVEHGRDPFSPYRLGYSAEGGPPRQRSWHEGGLPAGCRSDGGRRCCPVAHRRWWHNFGNVALGRRR